jgi:hypothetical protein|nr:MAG TPA: hypothetical protein [Bacteriophage sp.]
MERLTEVTIEDGAKLYDISSELCLSRTTQGEKIDTILKKLADYEDLEEQDRLVKLPCKVGDTLYWINGKFIINYKITGFSIDEDGVWIMHAEHCVKTVNKTHLYNIAVDTIGETAFFSESEAEAKLKELRNNND